MSRSLETMSGDACNAVLVMQGVIRFQFDSAAVVADSCWPPSSQQARNAFEVQMDFPCKGEVNDFIPENP